MKKIKTLLIAVTFLIIGLLGGCAASNTEITHANTGNIKLLDRVDNASTRSSVSGYISVYSYIDEENGVEYLIITNEKAGASGVTVTPRLKSNE